MKQDRKDWLSIQAILVFIAIAFGMFLLMPFVFAVSEIPMIYYRFEDNLIDEGDEELEYTLTPVNSPTYTTGKVNKAIDFEKDSSQYVYKHDCTVSEITKIRTIDFWFKPESFNDWDTVISINNNTPTNYLNFRIDNNDKLASYLYINSAVSFNIASTTSVEIGVWLHIILVMGEGGAKLYINGNTTPEATNANTDVLPEWSNIDIGKSFDLANYFDGLVDNVAFFDEQYTTDDVTYSWNGGNGINFLPLVDVTAPIVILNEPTNNSYLNIKTILFNATATDESDFENCSLWTNETDWGFKELNATAIINNTLFNIEETFTDDSFYLWNIECCDISDNCDFGEYNRTLNIDTTPPIISITSPNTTYNETYNVSVWINFTTNELANCNVNDTLWINQTAILNNDDFIFLETTAPNKFYSINISCEDLSNNFNSTIVYFIIDKISPNIESFSPKEDNTSVFYTDDYYLEININYTDDIDLYYMGINITDYNDTVIFSDSNYLSGTTYNYYKRLLITSWDNGLYTLTTSVADSHTLSKIKPAKDIKIKKDRIEYDFDNTLISIYSKSEFTSKSATKKLKDRYIFDFEYSKHILNKEFELCSNKEIRYLDYSKFKGHFVINKEFWVDFEQSGDVLVNKINNSCYLITVKNSNTKIIFSSIGTLNWNSESYIFEIKSFVPISVADRLAFTNQILFFTLFLGIWCFLVFASLRFDIPILLFMSALFGILISIVFIQTMAVESLVKNMMLIFVFINIMLMVVGVFIRKEF